MIIAILEIYIGSHDKLIIEISKKAKDAWIFGSYSQNKLKKDSDIDVLTKNMDVTELSSYFLKDIKKDLLKKIRGEGLKIGKGR